MNKKTYDVYLFYLNTYPFIYEPVCFKIIDLL